MKSLVVATVVLFCAILGLALLLSERADPVMLRVDAAALHHAAP